MPAKSQLVVSWEVVQTPKPLNQEDTCLRLCITYASGGPRMLRPFFRDRQQLETYIGRFHPELAGKERRPLGAG